MFDTSDLEDSLSANKGPSGKRGPQPPPRPTDSHLPQRTAPPLPPKQPSLLFSESSGSSSHASSDSAKPTSSGLASSASSQKPAVPAQPDLLDLDVFANGVCLTAPVSFTSVAQSVLFLLKLPLPMVERLLQHPTLPPSLHRWLMICWQAPLDHLMTHPRKQRGHCSVNPFRISPWQCPMSQSLYGRTAQLTRQPQAPPLRVLNNKAKEKAMPTAKRLLRYQLRHFQLAIRGLVPAQVRPVQVLPSSRGRCWIRHSLCCQIRQQA